MKDEKTRADATTKVGGKGAQGSTSGKKSGHYEGAKTIMKSGK